MTTSSHPGTDVSRSKIVTGIPGLDAITRGGLTPQRLYLVQGSPGVGKTTIGLQFLLAGRDLGERTLYISLSETIDELEGVARSHGWNLEGVNTWELEPGEVSLRVEDENTIFHPSEIELGEIMQTLLREVERIDPQRVVFDSLSEIRLLAQNTLRYRKQILALKRFFIGRDATVLLLDDSTESVGERHLETIAHGVIALEQIPPAYGPYRRRLRVTKMRGIDFVGGVHDFKLATGLGVVVFPRLIAADHRGPREREILPSGMRSLDDLLGGGIDRGTSTLIVGPAGSGKSAVAEQYTIAAAERGESILYTAFDEGRETLMMRAGGLGMPFRKYVDEGTIDLRQVDPAEMSAGEFSFTVQDAVERKNARLIVIDSLNGYLNAMPEERSLVIQLHELLTYLSEKNVTTILILSQYGLFGPDPINPVDVSYLADSVILLRYFEAAGSVKKAISVLKKRSGAHENTIRELRMSSEGLDLSDPLREFRGVLTGVPAMGTSLVLD